MKSRVLLAVVATAGVAVFALSFVRGWLVHDREVRGEGYRFVELLVDAWREPAVPAVSATVVLALVVGIAAGVSSSGRARVPSWVLLAGSVAALAVMAASAFPISQDGHASSVDVSIGPLLAVGIVLATLMVVAAAVLARPGRTAIVALAVAAMLLVAGGAAGRWWGLQLAEGTGRHWSEGSYVRQATEGEPTERMTIGGERVTIGDRWQGTWEWSGWTVVIDDDPACPESRGTYHAHGVGDDDLRFVMVVDTCQEGARAADLQTGIWEREE